MSEVAQLKAKLAAWLAFGLWMLGCWAIQSWKLTEFADRSQWDQVIWHGIVGIICVVGFFTAKDRAKQTYAKIKEMEIKQ